MGFEVRFVRRPDGACLAYATLGAGPPMVWVPGWISHLELMWEHEPIRRFFGHLASNHTLILYDKHGVGLSDRDRTVFTLDSEVDDLTTVLDELAPGPAVLIGNSQAGAVASAFAARRPDRVSDLILHGAWAYLGDLVADEVRTSLLSVVEAHWGLGSELIADLLIPGADAELRAWFARFQRESADARTALRLLELSYDLDVRPLLPQIRAPTLVLNRRDDRATPPPMGRELAALIPGARFRLVPGRVHFPWEEDPDTILREIGAFLDVDVVPTDGARAAREPTDGPRAVLRRVGEVWTVGLEDREVLLKDVKGLRYLAELLGRPGVEAHVIELVAAVEGAPPAGGDRHDVELAGRLGPDAGLGPVLDGQAREAYAARIDELREELAAADAANDVDRATAARTEIDALTEQLAGALGLGGRDRPMGATAERARVKVTRLLRDAIRRIQEADPHLGHLLDTTVRTGTYCSYQPPPDGGPRWDL